jgi:hypothetical protein
MGCGGRSATGDTIWHHDGREKLRFIRFFFYLDPLDTESGALRVIPGSHKLGDSYANSLVQAITNAGDLSAEETYQQDTGRHDEGSAFLQIYGVAPEEVPAAVLTSRPGDVILFDHRILHAAFGGDCRRFFTINFSERADEPHLADMCGWVTFHLRRAYPEPLVTGAMVATAGRERMLHLEQVLAHQGDLHELVRAELA